MNRKIISIVITAATIVIAVSCNNKKTSGRANTKNKDTQPTFVIDSLHVGDPVGICTQILTSIDALETITDTTSHCYDRETTLVKKGWQVFHTIREDSANGQQRKIEKDSLYLRAKRQEYARQQFHRLCQDILPLRTRRGRLNAPVQGEIYT